MEMSRALVSLAVAVVFLCAACEAGEDSAAQPPAARSAPENTPSDTQPAPDPSPTNVADENRWVTERPAWLGRRVLPLGPGGMGIPKPTPPILRNRRFATVDVLPPPKSRRYSARIRPVPDDVLARSSWRPKCPVSVDELAYLTMTFWGFDREVHTGEMIVHASVAEDVVGVFRQIFEARLAIEEMRVVTLKEMREWDTKPTGDTNLTSSFECREATMGSSWSEHAYGLAIDINPFHNPYLRGDIVGPELAGAYTDRSWRRPGMIFEGDAVTDAFDAIGWGWGGRWSSLKDWMHFSQSGH